MKYLVYIMRQDGTLEYEGIKDGSDDKLSSSIYETYAIPISIRNMNVLQLGIRRAMEAGDVKVEDFLR